MTKMSSIEGLIHEYGTDISGRWMSVDNVKLLAIKLITETAVAWSVCGSIHEKYAKNKDPLYTTRHQDFLKHEEYARNMIKEQE